MADSNIRVQTYVDTLEKGFFDAQLLQTEYLRVLRRAYDDTLGTPFLNPYRSYTRLLDLLDRIHAHDERVAKAMAKRIKTQSGDFRSCEAVFAEAIVYSSYIPLAGEGTIRSVRFEDDECDVRIERCDGSVAFLEIFCVMPNFNPDESGVIDVKTHLQTATASIRQKLLRKISKQGQMTQPRENWAVIELNSHTIAGDFSILSSLSDGYKISIDRETLRTISSGYDWQSSIFDDDSTKHLKGIMWFDLGDFQSRRMLVNPRFTTTPR